MFVFIFDGTAKADNAGSIPICAILGDTTNTPGTSSIALTLSVVPLGSVASVVGHAAFYSTSTPPWTVIAYSVSGAASQSNNGWWISLEGLGYDLALTPYRGIMGIQVSSDLSNNTFTYSH